MFKIYSKYIEIWRILPSGLKWVGPSVKLATVVRELLTIAGGLSPNKSKL